MRSSLRKWRAEAEPWYAAIGLANLVMGTSSILIPLMIAQVLRRSVGDVGLLSSLVSLVGVIGSLVWGRLSDAAHRRKPFVVLSFAAVSLGFAGIALSQSFRMVLLFNMILNFFWVANAAVSVLIVIENRQESLWEKKIGHLNQIGALGWLTGLIFGSLALAVASSQIGEKTKRFLLATLLAFAAIGFFAVPLPLLLSQQFALPSSTVFSYFVVLNSGVVLAYPLASRRIKRLGNKAVQQWALLMRLGLFVAAALYLTLCAVAPPVPVLVLFFLGIGVSWSYFQLSGVALASRLAKPKYRSQTLGLYNAIAGLGMIAAGVSSGLLAERVGYQATFVVASILLVISLIVLHRLPAPSSLPELASCPEKESARTGREVVQ